MQRKDPYRVQPLCAGSSASNGWLFQEHVFRLLLGTREEKSDEQIDMGLLLFP